MNSLSLLINQTCDQETAHWVPFLIVFSLVIKVNANQEIILLGGYSLESSDGPLGKALSKEA